MENVEKPLHEVGNDHAKSAITVLVLGDGA